MVAGTVCVDPDLFTLYVGQLPPCTALSGVPGLKLNLTNADFTIYRLSTFAYPIDHYHSYLI
jgi:hypothetical protein